MPGETSQLNVIIDKDADGNLSFRHPEGKDAIVMGKDATISCSLGTGFSGSPQFESLEVKYNNIPVTLNLDEEPELQTTFGLTNGPRLDLSSEQGTTIFISDYSSAPATGEWDIEFIVSIRDDEGSTSLDPEIKLKSGVAPQTASWVAGGA